MVDVDAALDEAGLKNSHVREYVRYWADLTGAERVEVVSAADDSRLIAEALEAGELEPAGEGLYYSRSYVKDTARSEERTIVATNNPADKGVYNNWRPASEMKPLLEDRMKHPVEPPGVVIGRGNEADLKIDDPGISRRHAEIKVHQSGAETTVTVVDLNSTNGVVLNGHKVATGVVTDGSEIRLGNTVIVIRMTEVGH